MAISPHVTSRMKSTWLGLGLGLGLGVGRKSTCAGRGPSVAREHGAPGEQPVSGAAVAAAMVPGGVLGARAAGERRRAYGGGSRRRA